MTPSWRGEFHATLASAYLGRATSEDAPAWFRAPPTIEGDRRRRQRWKDAIIWTRRRDSRDSGGGCNIHIGESGDDSGEVKRSTEMAGRMPQGRLIALLHKID
jgi:hypothetical protein